MDPSADPVILKFKERYLPRLKERFSPDLVIAFGSRARGDALKESDLDLMVVARSFQEYHFLARISLLLKALDIREKVDLLCYTPEEFQKKREELGIVRLALREGVVLHP